MALAVVVGYPTHGPGLTLISPPGALLGSMPQQEGEAHIQAHICPMPASLKLNPPPGVKVSPGRTAANVNPKEKCLAHRERISVLRSVRESDNNVSY